MFGWFRRKKKTKPAKEQKVVVDDKKGLTVATEVAKEVVETAPFMEEPIKTAEPQKKDPEKLPPLDLNKELPVEEDKKEEKEETKPKKKRNLPYHITKHPKGGWQIKRGNAERALKRFDTQKEAIEYAEELEKERGVGYVIHKVDGSVRKKDY